MAKNSLNVDTTELSKYANYLIDSETKLNDCLDNLDLMMSTITNGWKDDDGIKFKDSFTKFIAEARKISDETGKLGKFAKGESGNYETAVNTALRAFGGGGNG